MAFGLLILLICPYHERFLRKAVGKMSVPKNFKVPTVEIVSHLIINYTLLLNIPTLLSNFFLVALNRKEKFCH